MVDGEGLLEAVPGALQPGRPDTRVVDEDIDVRHHSQQFGGCGPHPRQRGQVSGDASAYSGYLTAHAEEIRKAKSAQLAGIAQWLALRIAADEIAPVPAPLIEVLVLGPAAEAARRWLANPADIDLAEAARVLPERVWHSLRPED
ncbi:hypothetical protein OHS70_03615 [Streptomyces sp. NBC_00390]|uniref:hypothetical protein n=1 Tax=Streptomyces sp. NBC_00390 TaxID=2975736 RepID=UPI002E1F66DC